MSNVDTMWLWTQLKQAGFVDGEAPIASDVATPWYVRTMLGIAGWIGALFLFGFVGVEFAFVIHSVTATLVVGALLCTAAAAISHLKADNDFASQFAFAMSLAGQGLVLFGLFNGLPSQINTIALLMAAVQAWQFLVVQNFLHRVWSAMIGICAFLFVLDNIGFHPYIQPLLLAAFSWVWLNEFSYPKQGTHVRALGYGLALMTVIYLLTGGGAWIGIASWLHPHALSAVGGHLSPWISAVLIGATLIGVALKLLAREGHAVNTGPGIAALAAAAILALVSVTAPGIGVTLVILVIGYAHGNHVLAGFGIFSLLGYLSHYYYVLEFTLLQKSVLLTASGVALLAACLALKRCRPTNEEAGIQHA